jgi:hypothetical protein
VKQLVCVYCEGNDTKIAAVEKVKDKIKVLKTISFDVLQPALEVDDGIGELKIEGEELTLEGLDKQTSLTQSVNTSGLNVINSSLRGIALNKAYFIPALTEPSIIYHIYEGSKKSKSVKLTQEIADDIYQTKNISVDKESIGYIELADKSILSVFLSNDVGCFRLINSLAQLNGKRYYKVPTVKSAEISLAYYVAKRKKFFPDDQSLIVYIGKEYSKLIFLHGRKLKHIGSTLDIGTINLNTYDVYFSKILLEMENGGISQLDNIIVCGEDDSENLILSFYGTFPEANVSRLEFDDLDLSSLGGDVKESFSAFSIPIAVANEYYEEIAEEYKGINLLPRYVKEDQRSFQFAWHGYAIVPILFAATFFITTQALLINKKLSALDQEIIRYSGMLRQNQELLGQISSIENKISSFGQTQAILDSASKGTGVWSRNLAHISDFFAGKGNLWSTRLTSSDNRNVNLEGYSLSKSVLTQFAYSINASELKGIFSEDLREKNIYKFNLQYNLSSYLKDKNE